MLKIHNFDILYHPQNVNSIITDGTDKKMVDYVKDKGWFGVCCIGDGKAYCSSYI